MRHPDSLFSIHNKEDGTFVLYIEEQDANLEMFEDILEQVSITDLALLKEAAETPNLRLVDHAKKLDLARKQMPQVATRIATMTEDEALSLAEIIIDAVKFNKAFSGKTKPNKLELVK